MEFETLIIPFAINIIICFGLPLGYLIYIVGAKKGTVKAYFSGTLVFLVTQVFLRIPLIQLVLPNMDWYITISVFHPIIYAVFIGVSAGLFEEVGRYFGFKFAFKRHISWSEGLAFGVGHGGIEAMLLTGFANVQSLIILISLQTGHYDRAVFGISEESIKAIFSPLSNINVLLGGLERIFAMVIHIGLTFMVLHGIKKRRKIYLLLAIFIHSIINSSSMIFQVLGFSIYIIELWIAICAIGLFLYTKKSKKILKEM